MNRPKEPTAVRSELPRRALSPAGPVARSKGGRVAAPHLPVVLLRCSDDEEREALMEAWPPETLNIRIASDSASALALLRSGSVQVAVLCVSGVGRSGFDLLKRIRADAETESLPVLIIAKGADYERIVSLELGADDSVLTPVTGREVWLRVRSLLRRSNALPKPNIIRTAEFLFDPLSHKVCIHGQPVHLTGTEFRLLNLLARRPGVVVERRELVETLTHHSGKLPDRRTINTHMRHLRKKLGPLGSSLQNIRGIGYRFSWHTAAPRG